MTRSALDGVFADTLITRKVRVPSDPPATTPAGDPVFDELEQEIRVIADSTDRDSLRERYGASAGEIVVTLSLLEPTIVPENVQPGAEFALTYAGRPGIVRIVARPEETLGPIVEALGEILVGVWRPA